MSDLEPILTYNMDQLEAKAYKLCLLWEKLTAKEFPGERTTKLRTTGDPRKSILFRYCYQLARETKGLIPDKEYKLYILAQLHVLKSRNDGKVHALIDPCILVGKKAWIRWKIWKRTYDRHLTRHKTSEELLSKERNARVCVELNQTKKFLESQGVMTAKDVQSRRDDIIRWIVTGKVSPYYAILSPLVAQMLNGQRLEDACGIDFSTYRSSLDESVKKCYEEQFKTSPI